MTDAHVHEPATALPPARPGLLAAIVGTARAAGALHVRFGDGAEVRVAPAAHGARATAACGCERDGCGHAPAAVAWLAAHAPDAVGVPADAALRDAVAAAVADARAVPEGASALRLDRALAAALAQVDGYDRAPRPTPAPVPRRRPADVAALRPVPPGRFSRSDGLEAWARAARADERLAERRAAVDELRERHGIAIVEPPAPEALDRYLVEDEATIDLALAIRNSFARGNRNVVLYGPPGVGKSTVPKRIAAMLGMGYVQITCARGMDTVMLLGTDVIELGPEGQPHQRIRLGTLAAAAQYPVVIELAEPAELDPDFLTNINQLLDEGLLTLWSAAPGEKTVRRHPDCVIVLTSNTGRADKHLPESIDDRAGVMAVLTYPEEDEEAVRIAVQALGLLRDGLGARFDPAPDAPPVAEQLPALFARAVATQRLVAHLRGEWASRANPRAPGLRAAAHFLAELEQCLAAEGLVHEDDRRRARERGLAIALKRFVPLWNLALHDPAVVEQELGRLALLYFQDAPLDPA